MKRVTFAVLGTFSLLLLVTGLLAYFFRDGSGPGVATSATQARSPTPAANQTQSDIPLIGELFGSDATGLSPGSFASWESTSARIALRFSLAAFLAALLAFRPRRGSRSHVAILTWPRRKF